MTLRPKLPMIDRLTGKELVRVGVNGKPMRAEVDTIRGRRRAGTFTTAANGTITIPNVPEEATVLLISPKTDGAIQRSVTRSGTNVTIAFRVLNTGALTGLLSSLFVQTAAVTFDFLAIEPFG